MSGLRHSGPESLKVLPVAGSIPRKWSGALDITGEVASTRSVLAHADRENKTTLHKAICFMFPPVAISLDAP